MADLEIDGISVSSSDESEESIRAAFAPDATEAAEPTTPAVDTGSVDASKTPAEPLDAADRNTDGTFKTKKARTDPQARMLEATAKEAEAKRERDALKAENDALKAERDARHAPARQEPPAPKVTAATDDPEPDPKTFPGEEYDPQYLKAQARWEGRAAAREFHAQQAETWRQNQQMRAAQDRDLKWGERLDAARTADPTFDSKIIADLPINAPTRDVIKTSELGPAILLHLNEHPDLARRLATLPPDATFREIGKIEHMLETRHTAALPTGSAVMPPPISSAKAIPKPVKASPPVSDSDADDADDLSEPAVLRHIKIGNANDPRINPRAARY